VEPLPKLVVTQRTWDPQETPRTFLPTGEHLCRNALMVSLKHGCTLRHGAGRLASGDRTFPPRSPVVLFGELTVHGWDLARATDIVFALDPKGVGPLFDLVRQTFGPRQDAARGTAFGPAVPVAEDAPIFDQTLGLLGRDPTWTP
jgi:hypothetical protein